MSNVQRKSSGFTLPELLVAVAIIVIMTGLIVPNWRVGEQSLALQRAAAKLGQDMRRAQELAMRAQAYTCPEEDPPGITVSGYGIFFDQNTKDSYILFAECNGSNSYTVGVDGIIETVTLERGAEIASVAPEAASSVVFIPPTPIVYINGDPGIQTLQVTLQSKEGSSQRTFTITNKGVIDVD